MARTFKAVYYTDVHFKRTPPQSRLDDYPQAILGKLRWILDYARKIGADIIFDGGDFFDRSVQSPWEIKQVYEVLKEAPAPIYTVAGNHPIKGNVDAWKPFSGLYLLEDLLYEGPCGIYNILDGFKADYRHKGTDVVFRLHHTDLVRRPVLWDHTLWDDYDAEGADVVLVSHYHPQQGVHQVNGTWFVSPGAVSRGSLGEDNLERIPAVAVIEFTKTKVKKIELVDIPCRPGEEVLNTSTVLKVVDIEKDMQEYDDCIATLREMVENTETTLAPEEIIKMLAKSHGTGKLVLDYALEKLEELRK